MPQTAPRTAPGFMGQEFNRFLFALVGTDRYGAPLSVVSALARLDLDAWAEAAYLARLPREAAVGKLSGLLRRYTEIPEMKTASTEIAARLVALLPARVSPRGLPAPRSYGWRTVSATAAVALLVALALLLGVVYGVQTSLPHPGAPTAITQPTPAPP